MAQTEGNPIYASDYHTYRRITIGGYHSQTVSYNLLNNQEHVENTNTSNHYKNTGGNTTRMLIYFNSGNSWVIPRKITYNYVALDNMNTSTTAQTGPCEILHTRITHPSTALAGGVSAGGTINASQLNSLYLELATEQWSATVSLNAGAANTFNLAREGNDHPAGDGWVRLGIRTFSTGYKHFMPYLVDAYNSTPRMGIRNFASSNQSGKEIYITIVYGRVVEKSSAYRTRVSAGTVIDNTHLDLAKLNCNGRETAYYNLSQLNQNEAVEFSAPSGTQRDSAYASYNQLGILNGFNSGRKKVFIRFANANTGKMVLVNYTGSTLAAVSTPPGAPGTGGEEDTDNDSVLTPRIYRALYYI